MLSVVTPTQAPLNEELPKREQPGLINQRVDLNITNEEIQTAVQKAEEIVNYRFEIFQPHIFKEGVLNCR